jgi:Zn-dependent M28 family amino/carboxypeptidase
MKNFLLFTYLLVILLFTSCNSTKRLYTKVDVDSTRLKQHVEILSKTYANRNFQNIEILNNSAEYIKNELSKTCDSVYFQTFMVNGREFKNVVGSIGLNFSKRLIVGAHYDVCENQAGADDNASGVAGLLELSRLLKEDKTINFRIDFVAYTLEEPPIYGTKQMGSYIHAKYLKDNKIDVIGMVCLEMIGYFNDAENSQEFPLSFLKMFYGNKGDFITVVQKFGRGSFARKFNSSMKNQDLIRTKSFQGPKSIVGIDFSDHRNYWLFGFSAVMINDTSFYRNKNYHTEDDTMEKLDFNRMTMVVEEIRRSIIEIQK